MYFANHKTQSVNGAMLIFVGQHFRQWFIYRLDESLKVTLNPNIAYFF